MNIKIEEAKKKDLATIVKLACELTDHHRENFDKYYKDSEASLEMHKKYIYKSFDKRNNKIIVAKNGKNIIGVGIGDIRKPTVGIVPLKIGKITYLYVKEKYRHKGVGRKMFEVLLDWYKQRNIKNIELSVDSRNKFAVMAYKKYGFFEYQKLMRIDLK